MTHVNLEYVGYEGSLFRPNACGTGTLVVYDKEARYYYKDRSNPAHVYECEYREFIRRGVIVPYCEPFPYQETQLGVYVTSRFIAYLNINLESTGLRWDRIREGLYASADSKECVYSLLNTWAYRVFQRVVVLLDCTVTVELLDIIHDGLCAARSKLARNRLYACYAYVLKELGEMDKRERLYQFGIMHENPDIHRDSLEALMDFLIHREKEHGNI